MINEVTIWEVESYSYRGTIAYGILSVLISLIDELFISL